MKKTLFLMLFLGFLCGGTSCSDDEQELEPTVNPQESVNQQVHDYLSRMYLWNHEYKQRMQKPDFAKDYDDFFYDALFSLTENDLDKRLVGQDEAGNQRYRLFSYIERMPERARSRSVPQQEKESSYTFGIQGLTPVAIGASVHDAVVYFCVQGVYPDSPADRAGLKRGAMIFEIDGKRITNANLEEFFYLLLAPEKVVSVCTTEEVSEAGVVVGSQERHFSACFMPSNPILCKGVEEGFVGHRIGYLNYASFDAGFDVELFEVFQEFHRKKVTDLILDLRYNGGGHTVSADLIATCIAGKKAQGKVFAKYRYNKERMAKYRQEYVEEPFSFERYANLKSSLADGFLDLQRVYCLVGTRTASASELVINALRGIDLKVVLIGERTTGKNVGMEYKNIQAGGHTYRVVPITFQSYNAKGFGDYQQGFYPDCVMDETNPFNEEGRFYPLRKFMTDEDPLYAKAVELITGRNRLLNSRGVWSNSLPGRVFSLPIPVRPGFEGMLRSFQP